MQVIDGAKGTQRVVTQPEVWVVAVLTELQSQADGGLIYQLSQIIHDTWHQQHMAILNGADIDEDQVWAVAGW